MKIDVVKIIKKELKDVKPKAKPKNPDRKLNLKEIIFELAPELEKLKNGGYGYNEIADILKRKGVGISPQTLSKYIIEYRGKNKPKPVVEISETKPEQEPESDFVEYKCEQDDECVVFTINHNDGII